MAGLVGGGGGGGAFDYVQDSQPAAPAPGEEWLDTSTDPFTVKIWNGAAWEFPRRAATAGDADNLGGSPPDTYENPAETSTTGISGGYAPELSEFTGDMDLDPGIPVTAWGDKYSYVQCDGAEFLVEYDSYSGSDITVRELLMETGDGTEVISSPDYVLQSVGDTRTISLSFEATHVRRFGTTLESTGGDFAVGQVDMTPHLVTLPNHTHPI